MAVAAGGLAVGKAKGPGPRSLEALRWLARVELAGVEPWGLAMGFGRRATYSHIERLQAEGLAMRLYDREGSVLAITAAGRRRVRAEGGEPRLRVLRGVGLRHARAVSWVAALLTVRGRTWLSERELRNRPDWLVPVFLSNSSGTHRPDAGAEVGGRRVAVEVELSHKAPRRLRAILAGYAALIADGTLDAAFSTSLIATTCCAASRARRSAWASPRPRFGRECSARCKTTCAASRPPRPAVP